MTLGSKMNYTVNIMLYHQAIHCIKVTYIGLEEEIVSIRSELNSVNPNLKNLKSAFKALTWGTSIAVKSSIEELVKKAIELF